ncbi:MAG: heterodisulfide reductase subunit C [Candidatus Riflebacteria bacterium]|nr:heterodisulfide reductase subunit C [Candidatus Riflebacteria bacterium]
MSHSEPLPHGTIAELVARVTGVSPLACYQCGRCAAGCPQNVPGEMEVGPTGILRLLQLEAAFAADAPRRADYQRRLLGSETPWLCAGCQACSTRCPQGVDLAGIMDVLRQATLRSGQAARSARARNAQALHETFLAEVLRCGRIHELTLVGRYKLATLNLFEDALLGPVMFWKGKLHLRPPDSRDTTAVRRARELLRRREAAGPGPGEGEGGEH